MPLSLRQVRCERSAAADGSAAFSLMLMRFASDAAAAAAAAARGAGFMRCFRLFFMPQPPHISFMPLRRERFMPGCRDALLSAAARHFSFLSLSFSRFYSGAAGVFFRFLF